MNHPDSPLMLPVDYKNLEMLQIIELEASVPAIVVFGAPQRLLTREYN